MAEKRKTKAMKRVANRVVAKVKDAENRARVSDLKRKRAGLYLWRLCVQLVRQWRKDHCPQHAAALSFQTILSLVPILAVILAAFKMLGAMGAESSLVNFLSQEFILVSPEKIADQLLKWSDKINFESVGVVGIFSTLVIAFFTFNGLEKAVNRIWRIQVRRSLPKRLGAFLFTATLGPLLLGLSLYQASQFGLSEGVAGALLSALVAFSGLFVVNYVLPATPVRVSAALVGAFINTLAAELAKLGFTYYVGHFAMDRYSGIYGTMAIIPIGLIWIYWSWLMLLLGVEVTHAVQNYHLLEKNHHGQLLSLADEFESHVNASMAVRITTAIAGEEDGLTRHQIATQLDLSDDAVRVLTNRLSQNEILQISNASKNWKLAQAPAQISVLRIFDAFEEENSFPQPFAGAGRATKDPLSALFAENRERASKLTIAELIRESE